MKSIYQEKNWQKIQEEKEQGKAMEYTYEDENGIVYYPFIKRVAGEIENTRYFDLVTARGERGLEIYLQDGGDKEKLVNRFNEAFQQYCTENNIIAEYIRFSPWDDVSKTFDEIYNIQYHGNLYCVDLSEDFFTTQMSSSLRRNIKKAKKYNIDIEYDFEGKTIEKFIDLYNYTEAKYNVSNYYLLNQEFIEKYFRQLKDKIFIINAYFDEKLISSCIILLGKDIAHYHFSANNPQYINMQANSYLLYESMLYAKSKKKQLFDLGGATPNSNLEVYKRKFVGKTDKNIYPYNIGTKIRNKNIYDKLVKKVGGPKKGYFPEYRR